MFFKLSEEFKGIEKEYKATLELSCHCYVEDAEREKPYTRDMFQAMLEELNNMEITMLIHEKETLVKLEVQREEEYKQSLIMSMKINKDEYEYQIEKELRNRGENEEIIEITHIESIIEDFKQEIHHFCIAVNISYPGLLEVWNTKIHVNNHRYCSEDHVLSDLLISVTEARRDNWPKISVLSIARSWKWLKQREGFIHGMATNAIERALSAFSYIYDCYSYEDLFYAMIGIEAIYVRNKEGILQQIKDKTRTLFGEPPDYMKRLKHMYNTRSRFIHGELNFPPRYCQEGSTQEFTKFSDEEYFDSKNFAQAILIASIQQFVIRDIDEIEFELKIKA